MAEGTPLDDGDELPMYDGISNGYGWTICLDQYWNARETEVHRGGKRIERESSEVVPVMEGAQSFCRFGNIYDSFQSITRNRERQDRIEVELGALDSLDGDAIGGLEAASAGKWSELARAVVVYRPPPESPNLNLNMVVTGAETQRKMSPCLRAMLKASLSTTDSKEELRGAGNATKKNQLVLQEIHNFFFNFHVS
ncbi:hypothetical protein PIB30_082645 [Stylosanthes scabra]|uniref:Uncharacterized protein n=1 Tax=Stylosanthes scabra TaxID=79078 RepID=A0ABU6WQC3_9FABA|nr:hypothetical protein [Stylosanthes scabra]